jgi:hypothetical protein
MTLGGWPDIEVTAARKRAHELGGLIAAGKDPQAEHMEAKSTDTFEWLMYEKCGMVGVALRLLLLTGQRPGEVAYINRRHIEDGQWWHMPGVRR